MNTVLSGPDTPSRLLLPFVPLQGVQLGPALACGAQEAVRCVAGSASTAPPTLPTPTLPSTTLPSLTLPPTTVPSTTVPSTTLPTPTAPTTTSTTLSLPLL